MLQQSGQIKRYRELFAPSPYTPFGIQTIQQQTERRWTTETNPRRYLTDDKVNKHRSGRYWVAPQIQRYTRTIIIDIDEDGRSLDKRTEAVKAAFPDVAPLMFSTPRGGLHLHFVLDKCNWANRAGEFATARLEDAGIDTRRGQVEVYPDGNRLCRAPLGRACHLLDDDGVPLHDDLQTGQWMLDHILAIERYDQLTIPPEWQADRTPAKEVQTLTRVRGSSSNPFMERVDELLAVGLTGPSQRTDALLKLNWYMHVIWGFAGERVEANLTSWIDGLHNGKSKDYNRSPDSVYRDIRSMVRTFDWDKRTTQPQIASRRPQTRSDAPSLNREVFRTHLDSLALDRRERRLLEQLLVYAHKRGTPTLNGELEVDIPSRTLKSFDWQYGRVLADLIQAGLVARVRNYGAQIGRCNRYVIEKIGSVE